MLLLIPIDTGLPTQVRDAALGVTNDMPNSDVNKEYYTAAMAEKFSDDPSQAFGVYGKEQKTHEVHERDDIKHNDQQQNIKSSTSFFCAFFEYSCLHVSMFVPLCLGVSVRMCAVADAPQAAAHSPILQEESSSHMLFLRQGHMFKRI